MIQCVQNSDEIEKNHQLELTLLVYFGSFFSTLNRKENTMPSLYMYVESFIFAAEAELDLISSCDPTQNLTWYFSVKAIRLLDIEIPDCSTLSTEEDKYKLSQTQLKLILKVRKALLFSCFIHTRDVAVKTILEIGLVLFKTSVRSVYNFRTLVMLQT